MAENRKQLLHVRSSVEGKLPTAEQIEHGEIAINFFDGSEKLSIKSSTGNIRTFSTDEQNNAKFETKERVAEIDEVVSKTFDTMNNSCGFNENVQYVPQNELIQGTTSLAEAIEIVAEKANSSVDTSTLATKQELTDGLAAKQDTLVSGTNIKTINGESILGSGDLTIEVGTSINVVQTTGTSETDVISQKIVTDELNKKIEDAPSDGFYYTRRNGEWVRDNDNLAIIEIDQTISDPATMISGDVNNGAIQWIRKNSHRVLAKKTGEGTITYIELDDNNSNKYAYDGSEAKTDGTEGDVFVKLPTFYYKGTEGDNVKLYFSLSKIDDEYVEWDTNTLIGAYEAYYDIETSKLQSRSGVISRGSISRANFKSYAAARGSGYQIVDWQMHCVLGCLFYAMYGNTNSQAICGSGTSSYTKTCGETNKLGMNDTTTSNGNTMSINFWGLENWWGNKYEYMEGIESTAANTVQILSPDPSSGRTFTWYNSSTFGKHYRFGKYLDLSSDVASSGSSSTYYCDYNFGPDSSALVGLRSYAYDSTYCGVSYGSMRNDAIYGDTHTGSRLAFRGIASKAESVEAFKALPIQ